MGVYTNIISLFTSIMIGTGSCEAAGYTECCTEGLCFGQPEDCSCDQFCTNFGDCCHDQPSICDASGIDLGMLSYILTI